MVDAALGIEACRQVFMAAGGMVGGVVAPDVVWAPAAVLKSAMLKSAAQSGKRAGNTKGRTERISSFSQGEFSDN